MTEVTEVPVTDPPAKRPLADVAQDLSNAARELDSYQSQRRALEEQLEAISKCCSDCLVRCGALRDELVDVAMAAQIG